MNDFIQSFGKEYESTHQLTDQQEQQFWMISEEHDDTIEGIRKKVQNRLSRDQNEMNNGVPKVRFYSDH